jgi:hypothetical protein
VVRATARSTVRCCVEILPELLEQRSCQLIVDKLPVRVAAARGTSFRSTTQQVNKLSRGRDRSKPELRPAVNKAISKKRLLLAQEWLEQQELQQGPIAARAARNKVL